MQLEADASFSSTDDGMQQHDPILQLAEIFIAIDRRMNATKIIKAESEDVNEHK